MDKILDKKKLQENLDSIIWKIEEARIKRSEHHIVQMVVVSKYTNIENIRTVYELGQRSFGENHVQQLEERMKELEDLPLQWHMIGRLQKNKINKLIDLNPALLQSLDSLDLAEALNKRLETKNRTMPALLQINSAKEESKAGVMPEDAISVYRKISESFPHIKLKGVMSIGAHSDDRSLVKESFERTYSIFSELKKDGAEICSMGMSHDFELAIECGSNLVRIGSAIFKD